MKRIKQVDWSTAILWALIIFIVVAMFVAAQTEKAGL